MLAYNMLWSNDFYGHIVPSWMSEKKISKNLNFTVIFILFKK